MIVCITDLKVGMTLAADVKGNNGRLLLPSGTVLEEQHLRIFNIWGVSEADVKDTSAPGEAAEDQAEFLEAARVHAETLFAHAAMDESPMEFLMDACIKLYAKKFFEGMELPVPASPLELLLEMPPEPLFDNPSDFLKNNKELGAFPHVYYKIMDALENPLSTASTLADIISKEPGICARVLNLVNSPLYGFSKPVDSLSRAVSMLGTKALSQLAIGVTVMERFKGLDDEQLTMVDFWKHSLACGTINKILSSQISGTSQNLCFLAGMIHDLGRLVMLQIAPAEVNLVHQYSKIEKLALDEAERRIFGFDHCDLAKELFNKWNFPDELIKATVCHHGPRDGYISLESAICLMGDTLAVAMQYGSNGNEFVHTVPSEAWETLALPQSVLATTIIKAERQINDIFTLFTG